MTVQVLLTTPDGKRHSDFTSTLPAAAVAAWGTAWFNLDELLGVHVYLRTFPNGDHQLGVRFSNGCTHSDGTGFLGRLYYSALAVIVDGVTIPIINGGSHVFPPRAILERRFTIRNGVATRGWDYDAPPNPAPPFGPAREALPPVDRAHYAQVFAGMIQQLKQALRSGSPCTLYPWGTNGPAPAIDLRSSAFGPFHPDGYPAGDAPAGYGIDFAFGWEQCREALIFASMAHECAMDRNPVAAYDADTGEQITCTDWATNYLAHGQLAGSKLELPAFLTGTYGNFSYANANEGSSPYQAALEAYQPDNTEHLVRAIRRAAALVGWANDPMATDDLVALFEYHRTLWFGDRADDKTHASDGSYVPPSLSALHYYSTQNPGHGAPVLRSFGWIMQLGAWADAPQGWAIEAIDTCLALTDKFGLTQREPHPPYIPAGWEGTQHFHSVLIHVGAWTLARAAGYREQDVCDTIDRWRASVLQNPAMPLEQRPDGPGSYGPPKWIYTQGPDGEVPRLTAQNADPAGFQEHVLALLGRRALSGDARLVLKDGLGVDLPAATLMAKLAQMQSHMGDQGQYASYFAALAALA